MSGFNPIKIQINKTGKPLIFVFSTFERLNELKKYSDHIEIINGDHLTNIKIFFTDSTKDEAYRISKKMIDDNFAIFDCVFANDRLILNANKISTF